MRPMHVRALALTLALAPGVLYAQEAGEEERAPDRGAQVVHVTKLYEAFKKSEWEEVVKEFELLKDEFEGTLNDKRLVFLNAQALYNLAAPRKKFDQAALALQQLLDLQEDHVGGLYLLAKIHAQSDNLADKERAKDLLLQSARAGQFVLRDISSPDGQKVFADLLKDPGFILRVMNASNEFAVTATNLRNPFQSPLRAVDQTGGAIIEGPADPGLEDRLKELERRVDDLFKDIEKLALARQVEELIGKFTELRSIMAEYGQHGSDVVKKKMEKWNQRLAAFGEVQLSIQLQIYINEGNQHLRAMADSIKRDEYDAALERFEQIKELKDQMFNEEREVFHRNAEALFLRGKALADRATRLKRIAEFVLVVSGIVVTPPDSEERDKAIINDTIYQEGETLLDTESDEPIEGLRVVEILPNTVRFRYEDTEFVRELRLRAP